MSSSDCGRIAAASGATGSALRKKSFMRLPPALFFPEQVGALGRLEAELRRINLGIAYQPRESQQRGLAEVVGQLHGLDSGHAEAHSNALEPGLAFARLRLQPFEPVALAGVRELECPLDVASSRKQRGRRRA